MVFPLRGLGPDTLVSPSTQIKMLFLKKLKNWLSVVYFDDESLIFLSLGPDFCKKLSLILRTAILIITSAQSRFTESFQSLFIYFIYLFIKFLDRMVVSVYIYIYIYIYI